MYVDEHTGFAHDSLTGEKKHLRVYKHNGRELGTRYIVKLNCRIVMPKQFDPHKKAYFKVVVGD